LAIFLRSKLIPVVSYGVELLTTVQMMDKILDSFERRYPCAASEERLVLGEVNEQG